MFTARDIMQKHVHTLRSDLTIAEAIEHFKRESDKQHVRIFGMIVADDEGRVVGMLSMYDILLFVRPKHAETWDMITDLEVTGLLEMVSKAAQSATVQEFMTPEVITIPPDTHIMTILDLMIRKHIRRIPVVSDGTIQGMVYLSDLFYFLVEKLTPQG
jgi:CBS domain-containing protein